MRLPPAPTRWLASWGIIATGERMRATISRSTCAMSSAQSDSSGCKLAAVRLPWRETLLARADDPPTRPIVAIRCRDMIPTMEQGLTEDTLLGGRVRLLQPARGYRVAVDAVLLAAAVGASAGERVLD